MIGFEVILGPTNVQSNTTLSIRAIALIVDKTSCELATFTDPATIDLTPISVLSTEDISTIDVPSITLTTPYGEDCAYTLQYDSETLVHRLGVYSVTVLAVPDSYSEYMPSQEYMIYLNVTCTFPFCPLSNQENLLPYFDRSEEFELDYTIDQSLTVQESIPLPDGVTRCGKTFDYKVRLERAIIFLTLNEA